MTQPPSYEASLPPGFATVDSLLDGKMIAGSMVNVVGLVTDFRAPTPTRAQDWKCQITLYDKSVEFDPERSLEVNFFDPKDQMPDAECGDVVVVLSAKVQNRQEKLSLLTSRTTSVYIFSASKIPQKNADIAVALVAPFKKPTKPLTEAHRRFALSLYHSIDKERLPTQVEFHLTKVNSVNVKDKFKLLQDVRGGDFCDLVVQVVKEPYDAGDQISLWVSDFTDNPAFFNHALNLSHSGNGDPYGYNSNSSKTKTKTKTKASTAWTGPFGKKSLQISCWEPHATTIRNFKLAHGSWVCLKNIYMAYGNNGANLEGYLREDRGAFGHKIQVTSLDLTEDPENIDPRLKEALRRKRDYEKNKRHQLKDISEAAEAGQKRKSDMGSGREPQKKNSKSRRKAQRESINNVERSAAKGEAVPAVDLNPLVKCENQNRQASSVAQITQTVSHEMTIDGQQVQLPLPFINTHHRAHVRIVDFRPSKLEDFACAKRKSSEFDVLSDNDDTDSASESEQDMMTEFTTERDWEWRFYLKLEDAAVSDNQQKNTVWVVVNNADAQGLTDLDASDLKRDCKNLDDLRHKLFFLWGDLEEHKSRLASESNHQGSKKRAEDAPPQHSDDEGSGQPAEKVDAVTNRPFSCCIRQYGVRVSEEDPAHADAGEGKRWQRMYGLFGTVIISGV